MLSQVYGIINRDGILRVVIEQPSMIAGHVAEGERLYTIPGFRVKEPVTQMSKIAGIIERVQAYVAAHQ